MRDPGERIRVRPSLLPEPRQRRVRRLGEMEDSATEPLTRVPYSSARGRSVAACEQAPPASPDPATPEASDAAESRGPDSAAVSEKLPCFKYASRNALPQPDPHQANRGTPAST